MDSVRSYFGFGKVVLPTMGHMGCAWSIVCAERHHEIGNAIMQPLPTVNGNEKRQEISLLFLMSCKVNVSLGKI